ncbi:heterokaryon incompatibility protein-domain-containing protein [Xylariaceae sp. FL1272]|nr:heterokaryon incompatibility protein-domain-containing protein [Xylariaceae sp. FL1272]
MRLLNVDNFQLEEFFEPRVPPYVILSHTWDGDEVLFQDIQPTFDGTFESLAWSTKKGARKVFDSAAITAKKGHKYIWIDTCCIDKSSSSELSEAINSMFNWYLKSSICFVYLADFALPHAAKNGENDCYAISDNQKIEQMTRRRFGKPLTNDGGGLAPLHDQGSHDTRSHDSRSFLQGLKDCRWFTRGWTLQELIAPHEVQFYDGNWTFFGTRISLSESLQQITNIAIEVLVFGTLGIEGRNHRLPRFLKRYSVWEKMVWAAARETLRVEDTAYCLLGIFDINMPLLYGEGPRAFLRLLKKIMKQTNDHSMLFFSRQKYGASFLPHSPVCYRKYDQRHKVRSNPADAIRPLKMVSDGISMTLLLCPVSGRDSFIGVLNSVVEADGVWIGRPALLLGVDDNKFYLSGRCMYLIRPGDEPHAEIYDLEYRSPSKPNESSRLPVDFNRARVETIEIQNETIPCAAPTISRTALGRQIRLCPLDGPKAADYTYGICYPEQTGNMGFLRSNSRYDGPCLECVICIKNIEQPDDDVCSLIICCVYHHSSYVAAAVTAPALIDSWRDMQLFMTKFFFSSGILSDSFGTYATKQECPIQLHCIDTDTAISRSSMSTVLRNGHSAYVEVRDTDFLGLPLLEVRVSITDGDDLNKSVWLPGESWENRKRDCRNH